jgi:uncharacterized protein
MINFEADTSDTNPDILRYVAEQHEGKVVIYAAVLVEGIVRAGDEILLAD